MLSTLPVLIHILLASLSVLLSLILFEHVFFSLWFALILSTLCCNKQELLSRCSCFVDAGIPYLVVS